MRVSIVGPFLVVFAACPPFGTGTSAEDAITAYDHRLLTTYLDEEGRPHPIRTADDWNRRREHVLEGLQLAMGKFPMRSERLDVEVRVLATKRTDDYERRTITYVAEPGDRVPADLYVPTGLKQGERRPAMLALHPTGALGKRIVAGEGPRANREYAIELAKRGYVVIAPDYPSFGDYPYDFGKDAYVSGSMKGIVNHVRAVDVLESLDVVDPRRIGVIGHSLGGHNAMFVAVFDPRLRVVVSSCGWTPFHDYYEGRIAGWTSPRYMPRLKDVYGLDPDRVPFDFAEVVAALAPRPFFSNSPLHDANFAVSGVRNAVSEARRIYTLLEAKDRLRVVSPDCEHDFPTEVRRAAYEFVDAALDYDPETRSIKEMPKR